MALNIILDIVLVGLVLGGAALGISKGVIKILTKPLKPLIAAVLAIMLAGPLAGAFVDPLISEPVLNQISGFLYENCPNISGGNLQELPTLIKLAAVLVGVDVATLGENTDDVIASVVETLATPLIHIISTVVSFVVLYVALKLLISLLFSVANSVFDHGVFGVLNRVLGCVTSGLLAIFTAWALVSVFEYVIHFPAIEGSEVLSNFTGGFIYNLFRQYNPVELLLSF